MFDNIKLLKSTVVTLFKSFFGQCMCFKRFIRLVIIWYHYNFQNYKVTSEYSNKTFVKLSNKFELWTSMCYDFDQKICSYRQLYGTACFQYHFESSGRYFLNFSNFLQRIGGGGESYKKTGEFDAALWVLMSKSILFFQRITTNVDTGKFHQILV